MAQPERAGAERRLRTGAIDVGQAVAIDERPRRWCRGASPMATRSCLPAWRSAVKHTPSAASPTFGTNDGHRRGTDEYLSRGRFRLGRARCTTPAGGGDRHADVTQDRQKAARHPGVPARNRMGAEVRRDVRLAGAVGSAAIGRSDDELRWGISSVRSPRPWRLPGRRADRRYRLHGPMGIGAGTTRRSCAAAHRQRGRLPVSRFDDPYPRDERHPESPMPIPELGNRTAGARGRREHEERSDGRSRGNAEHADYQPCLRLAGLDSPWTETSDT